MYDNLSPRGLARAYADQRALLHRTHRRGGGSVREQAADALGVGTNTLDALRTIFETPGVSEQFQEVVDVEQVPILQAARAIREAERRRLPLDVSTLLGLVQDLAPVKDDEYVKEWVARVRRIRQKFVQSGTHPEYLTTILDQVELKEDRKLSNPEVG